MPRPPDPSSIPPAALVEHASFVRSVARAILGEGADADDVAQEALLQGLSTGPASPGARRPWLAGVVRNLARHLRRREARVRARQRRGARPERMGSVIDAMAHQEVLHAVAAAVDALAVNAREVVLLRHYHGLPPREIATRLGLPLETVKKRLMRAHQSLRASLGSDGRTVTNRRMAVLAAFAGTDHALPIGPIAAGGVAMALNGKALVAGVAAAALLGFGAWSLFDSSGDAGSREAPDREAAALQENTPPAPALEGAAGPPPAAPSEVAPPTPPKPVPRSWLTYQRGRVTLRMPREWTQGGEISWELPEAGRWGGPLEVGGRMEWAVIGRKEAEARLARMIGPTETGMRIDRHEARVVRGRERVSGREEDVRVLFLTAPDGFQEPFAFVVMLSADAPPNAGETLDMILSHVRVASLLPAVAAAVGEVPGDVVEVAVLMAGSPAAGSLTVERWNGDSTFQDDGSWKSTRGPPNVIPLDRDGRARFDAPQGGTFYVTVHGPTIGAHEITTMASGRPEERHPRLVLALGDGVVRGRAFARDGRPAAGARVRFRASNGAYGPLVAVGECPVDSRGAYELRGLPRSHGIVQLELPALEGMPQAPREERVDLASANPIGLDIGDETPLPIWRGTVIDVGGRTVEGPGYLVFTNLKPQPGGWNWQRSVIRRDGRFEARVAPGTYRVSGSVVRPDAPPRTIDALEVEITTQGLDRDVVVGGAALVVRVRQTDGKPAAGVDVAIEPASKVRTWSTQQTADADGVVRFTGLPAGQYRLTTTRGAVSLRGGGEPVVEVRDSPGATETDVELRPSEMSGERDRR